MGTRSLTVIKSNEFDRVEEICVLYRQYDGYITGGHGEDLGKFLSDFSIGNGLRRVEPDQKYANGAHCLAAQIIANFKTEPGHFYLYPASTRDMGEEYTYVVTAGHHLPILIEVYEGLETDNLIFSGTPQELATHQE